MHTLRVTIMYTIYSLVWVCILLVTWSCIAGLC